MASRRHSCGSNDEETDGNPVTKRRRELNDTNTNASPEDPERSCERNTADDSVGMTSFVDDIMAMSGERDTGSASHHHDTMIREQDRFLPIANVSRIMKRVLPESGKVAKEAKECIQECVSEFISFITSEASERCMHEKRKTINGEDILWAMQTLGFDPYVEPLKMYLAKYRTAAKGDKQDNGGAGASVFGQGLIMVEKPEGTNEKAIGDAEAAGTVYLTQDDILRSTGDHHQQRQVHLTTGADGQLTIIEMEPDSDGHTNITNDVGATAITLPMVTGDNGGQQYILTTLDQSALSSAGLQQFALQTGAQLAFLPANGSTNIATTQGIPVVFIDSSTASVTSSGHQQPQYITMNAPSGGNAGLQIVHVTPSSSMTGATDQARSAAQSRANACMAVSEGQ